MIDADRNPDIIIKYQDDTFVKIIAEPSIKCDISDVFCFDIENKKYHPKVKSGIWDGRIRLFSSRNGTLPIGLVDTLISWARSNDYSVEDTTKHIYQPNSIDDYNTWLKTLQVFDGEKIIEPFWYQLASVKHIVASSRGILNLPTSAGKSLIIGLLSKYFFINNDKKVLILVPTVSLVQQMKDDLCNYRLFTNSDIHGIKSGTMKDNHGSCIYVSTWQSAAKQPTEWFSQFGMLITDECHLAVATNLTKINQCMLHCRYKVGLTGTLKDCKSNVMQLVGLYGPIYRPTDTASLIKEGKVSPVAIKPIILSYPTLDKKLFRNMQYADEIKWITGNKKRNTFISKLALAAPEQNTLVLFRHIEHGIALYEQIKSLSNGREVHYISGNVKAHIREELRDKIENSKGAVIIASYGTTSTGVSIKNLHRAIVAHPVKSKIINLQSIGRILRKHSTKEAASWYDLIDDLRYTKSKNNFAYEHGIARLRLYNRENLNYKLSEYSL